MIAFMEQNLPGFKDNVNMSTIAEYERYKKKLLADSRQVTSNTECLKTLTYYVEYFKDQHTMISSLGSDVDWEDAASVRRFLQSDAYQASETYPITSNQLNQYPLEDIRGVYQNKDKTLTLAIVEDKTVNRDYVGVVAESHTDRWKKDQIMLEIKRLSDDTFSAFVYNDDRSMNYRGNYPFVNGILGDIWYKSSLDEFYNPVTDAPDDLTFKLLSDSIAYVRVPWFFSSKSKSIRRFIDGIDPIIRSTKYLIIDVRNNGGGSDRNALLLMDYIYRSLTQWIMYNYTLLREIS